MDGQIIDAFDDGGKSRMRLPELQKMFSQGDRSFVCQEKWHFCEVLFRLRGM